MSFYIFKTAYHFVLLINHWLVSLGVETVTAENYEDICSTVFEGRRLVNYYIAIIAGSDSGIEIDWGMNFPGTGVYPI